MTEVRKDKIDVVLEQRTRHITVVLENIYHPHNASAIIRNCECFGIQDMHVIEDKFEYKPSTDIVRGSLKWLSLNYHRNDGNNSQECVEHLKAKGYKIAATCLRDDTISIDELPIEDKIAIVFGTEDKGVSSELMEKSDYTVKIPMCGFTQSLNVSVSAAICIRELTKRLKKSDIDWHLSEEEKSELRLDWYKKSVRSLEKLLQHYNENKRG